MKRLAIGFEMVCQVWHTGWEFSTVPPLSPSDRVIFKEVVPSFGARDANNSVSR
jgi:hypothetical protein